MVKFVISSLLAPAAVAVGAIYLLERLRGDRQIAAAPLALSLAFFAGCLLLPDAPLKPDRHWHWLPYAGLLAAAVAALASDRHGLLRAISLLVVCAITAWFLVPTWESLQPSRGWMMISLATYLWFVAAGMDRVFANFDKRCGLYLTMLVAAAAISALCIAKEVSLTYGRLAAIAAAAMTGLWLASAKGLPRTAFRGLGAVFSVLVGGAAFVGFVDPEPPLWGLMLMPLAPLGALPGAVLEKESKQRTLAQIVGFVAMIGLGVAIIYATQRRPAAEW